MARPRRPERAGESRGAGARRSSASRARPSTASGRPPGADPYIAGLTLLAGRDLSAAQLADRLRRRGYTPQAADGAIVRLRREGALDDHRAAAAFARRAMAVRRRGPARIARELAARGVDPSVAEAAIAEALDGRSPEALLEQSLDRRLSGPIASRAEFRRLYQYLLRQGFEGAMAAAALRRRAEGDAVPDE
ncbi:MAG: regulatory protein RecX [Acidobacteria bacterium]|nr:regulatory protein RecX [Acidobacteriota bacterium]